MARTTNVTKLSGAALVTTIRTLTREHTMWRLTHAGEEPATVSLLQAAIDEASRRNITIHHPEVSNVKEI